jgi:hypothetical protein
MAHFIARILMIILEETASYTKEAIEFLKAGMPTGMKMIPCRS